MVTRMSGDVDIAIRVAGVIDIARDVAAECGVARPTPVDRENPNALAGQIALLPPPGFGLGHQLALVLDDTRVFADPVSRVDTPPRDRRTAADDTRQIGHGARRQSSSVNV